MSCFFISFDPTILSQGLDKAAKQTGDKLSGVIGRENVEKVRYELKVLQVPKKKRHPPYKS